MLRYWILIPVNEEQRIVQYIVYSENDWRGNHVDALSMYFLGRAFEARGAAVYPKRVGSFPNHLKPGDRLYYVGRFVTSYDAADAYIAKFKELREAGQM